MKINFDFNFKKIFPYLILIILSSCLFLPGISTIPTQDRDEALYVQASRQMLQEKTYTQINVQEDTRHLKPPGIYWLQAGLVSVTTGVNSQVMWPYRLVSCLGNFFALLGVFIFWRKSLGEPVALLAACFLGFSFLLNIETHIANTDSVLLACMVFMQGALFKCYESFSYGQKVLKKYIWIFWLAMSLGILIKGITPLVGFLTILFLLIGEKKHRGFFKTLKPVSGFCVLILLTLLWLVPLSLSSHSNFLWDMVHGDVLPKLTGGQESHGFIPGYFLLLLPLMFFPASLLFPEGARLAWLDRRKAHMKFLLAWIIPSWIFFELIPTKLPQYVLPMYPALALIFSLAALRLITIPSGFKNLLTKIYQVIWLFCAGVLSLVLIILPKRIEGVYSLIGVITALILFALSLLVLWAHRAKKLKSFLSFIFLLSLITWPAVFGLVLPELKDFWITQKLVQHLKQDGLYTRVSPKNPILISGYLEPSVIFNIGTFNIERIDDPKDLAQKLKSGTYLAGILLDTQQASFNQEAKKIDLKTHIVDEVNGFEYNGGHWRNLVILEPVK